MAMSVMLVHLHRTAVTTDSVTDLGHDAHMAIEHLTPHTPDHTHICAARMSSILHVLTVPRFTPRQHFRG